MIYWHQWASMNTCNIFYDHDMVTLFISDSTQEKIYWHTILMCDTEAKAETEEAK